MHEIGQHERAHAGTRRQEQWQGRKSRQILGSAAQVEIVVQHEACGTARIAPHEIHEQESKIVKHIDGGDRLAELDRVEEFRHPLPHHDVLAVRIAVAAADQPGVAAAVQQGLQPVQRILEEGMELERLSRLEEVR